MNIRAASCSRRQSAFTMVEIAISLGVIAFALVAILAILPTGLQTQRDNREDTLINQDARVILEAIRNGGREAQSDLGAFVLYTNGIATPNGIPTPSLIQLLCELPPDFTGLPYTNRPPSTNLVVLASISGAAATRGSDLSFRYQIRPAVVPTSLNGSAWSSSNEFTACEVFLRFAWPVSPSGTINSEANTLVARSLLSGWYDRTNNLFYTQEYRR